jgi:hypothetical protein
MINDLGYFSALLIRLSDYPDQVDSLLDSRMTISGGQKVALEHWFRPVKDWKARDSRNMIYGGLAVVKPDTLLIDPTLKDRPVDESAPPLHPRTSKSVWPRLEADYNIKLPTVLERVALYLLTTVLLSLVRRHRFP